MFTWLTALLLALVGAGLPQGAPARLRIVEPSTDGPLMGAVVIRASLEPATQAYQRATFFIDGRVACRVEQGPLECAWNAGEVLREHTIRVEALLPTGRRIAATLTTQTAVDPYSDNVDRVMVTVAVLDGDHFVRGLRADAFQVYEDNVRMKTDFFNAEESTLEVAVGVDISESMTRAIDDVKQNVKRFLSKLRPEDKATIGAFNEQYYVVAPPSVDRAAQLRKVDQLAPWGMTSLYDMVLRSFDQLSGRPGRRALVLFTDGEDTSSRVPQQAVEKRVARNDAVLYIIGQGNVLKSPDLKALCERLATKSGGRAFFPTDAAGLASAFDAVTEELTNQYLLTYDPRSLKRDGRMRRFRVEVKGGYHARHAEGYVPK